MRLPSSHQRYKELFTLYFIMSIGYAELYACKDNILFLLNGLVSATVREHCKYSKIHLLTDRSLQKFTDRRFFVV